MATVYVILIGSTGSAPIANSISGTANQVLVNSGTGTITLSTPQDIAATLSPTFSDVGLSNLTPNKIVSTNSSRSLVSQDISGTSHQVIVTGTPGAGTITLSTPQDIATTRSPTFQNVTANDTLVAKGGGLGLPVRIDSETLSTAEAFSMYASNGISVSGGNSLATVSGGGGVNIVSNAGQLHMSASGINPSLPVQVDMNKNVFTGAIALNPTNLSGTLQISLGRTNSSTALANGKLMVSTGGAIREGTSSTDPIFNTVQTFGGVFAGAESLFEEGVHVQNSTGPGPSYINLVNGNMYVSRDNSWGAIQLGSPTGNPGAEISMAYWSDTANGFDGTSSKGSMIGRNIGGTTSNAFQFWNKTLSGVTTTIHDSGDVDTMGNLSAANLSGTNTGVLRMQTVPV